MKKFFIIFSVSAILLAACENQSVDPPLPTAPTQETQVTQIDDRLVKEIEMYETGGEDGRANHWRVFTDEDGVNTLIFEDMRMDETKIFELSDADYNELIGINFAEHIGKKDNNDGVCDAVYFDITIRYDNDTEERTEANIPDLWRKFYHYLYECEPVSEPGK